MHRIIGALKPHLEPVFITIPTIIFFIGLYPILSINLHALNPYQVIDQYSQRIFTPDDGLPQSSVLAITQTREGYLWFGTFEGLARFDGVQFTVFDKINTPEMKNNGINCLYEDRHRIFWIGTRDGLLCKRGGEYRNYTTADGLTHNHITALYEDVKGRLWVGNVQGFNCIVAGKVVLDSRQKGMGNILVMSIAGDRKGTVWLATSKNGIFSLREGRLGNINRENGLPDNHVESLYYSKNGTLWAGTANGLVRFFNGNIHVYTVEDGLSDNYVTHIYEDRKAVLWVGTYMGRLNRFIRERFEFLSLNPGQENKINSIYEDLEGSLWVGTYRGGVYLFRDRIFKRYDHRNGLPVDVVRTVLETRSGTIWIGTVGGGLIRYRDNTFKVYGHNQGLRNLDIRSIAEARNGSIWFATYGGGLHHLSNGKMRVFTTRHGLSNNIIRVVFVDSMDNVWIGTNGGGVDIMDSKGKITNFNSRTGLSGDYIYAISEDNKGNVWIGTFGGGLNRFTSGHIHEYGLADGLPGSSIWAIYPDSRGSIWLGTGDGGLCRLKDEKISRFTRSDGLYSDVAFNILEKRDRLWMNSNRGIYSVKIDDLDGFLAGKLRRIPCRVLASDAGFVGFESPGPAQPASTISRTGELWFPTLKGMVVLNPEASLSNPVPPPVMIEKLLVDGKEYSPSGIPRLPPGVQNIEIRYTGLSFVQPDKVRFKYCLIGFQDEWVDVGPRRAAYFTNIRHGNYRFKVIACNNKGIWNRRGASISFTILPRFYETRWFYSIIILSILLLFWMGYKMRIRKLQQRQLALQRMVAERTSELRQLNKQLEQLSNLDGLTEIFNRRYFDEYFENEFRRSLRASTAISLLMIDVDFFKAYNDTYGHQKGDVCLRSLAVIFKFSAERPGDIAARYGGEEFAVILAETDLDGAKLIAEKIRKRVAALEIPHSSSTVSKVLTVSIGVSSMVPKKKDHYRMLIEAADRALYLAKKNGRNRVEIEDIGP